MKNIAHSFRRFSPESWLRIAVLAAVALAGSQVLLAPSAAEATTNRGSCAAITGTAYLSAEERAWYWAHCLGRPLSAAPAASGGSVAQQFADGFRYAGGPEHLMAHFLNRVIPCESTYNVYAVNRSGPYYGLLQFLPSTWYASGGGDWFNAWQQGANAAKLVRVANPATQWPHCWFA